MLRAELFRSCSNAAIADVALRSMGCEFHARVREIARRNDSEPGAYAAGLVGEFFDEAGSGDLKRLEAVMSGADMPLLTGFRFVVEDMLDRDAVLDGVLPRAFAKQSMEVAA
ncbi:MAG: hypothetical protein KDJ29_11250 [Hyphomicrobiales bacterium]|nr:hypothetical protein [Hyphomicrobiales bacterium]